MFSFRSIGCRSDSVCIAAPRYKIYSPINTNAMPKIYSQYAAVTADTWSSELGILSKTRPILITSFKSCPPGTNGGVSRFGLTAGLAGGAFIGLLASLFTPFCESWTIISRVKFIFGVAILGLAGSIIDSVLGATLQQSVANEKGLIIEVEGGEKRELDGRIVSGSNILSNNAVNLLMACITTALSVVIANKFYGFR